MDIYSKKIQPTFVIIGAGVSGLTTARYCLKNNYNIIILEKNSNIGGVWFSKNYPNISLQTTKYSYSFSDLKHFEKTNLYPSGEELMIYFKEYAKKYNILNYTFFNCEVIKTEFDYEDEVWNITYLDHTDNTKINIKSNYLIVASGMYTDPLKFNLNNKNFTNYKKIIESNRFSSNGDLKMNILSNKNVVIIGNGPTGCDLATLSLDYKPKSVTILYRTKRWILKRYLWKKISTHYILSRFTLLLAKNSPKILYIITVSIYYYLVVLFSHNIWKLSNIKAPLDIINRKNLVLNDTILKAIYDKKINYIQTNIIDIDNEIISIENNKKIEYDICILATGYQSNIKYLNMNAIPYLYKHIIDPNLPNSAFIGYAASFNWIQISELQIQWYLAYLKEKIKHISRDDMIKEINYTIQNKSKKEYDYHDLALSAYQYCDSLADDIGIKKKYTKYNFKYWFKIPEHDLWSPNNI